MKNVEIRPAAPGEIEEVVQEATPKTPLVWIPVGLSLPEWRAKIGGHPLEQGTLFRTDRGVFASGMCGAFFLGQKREDGSVDSSSCSFSTELKNEVIHEYADTPGCGYTRDERGVIVLDDEDEDW
jgi:hypothetical protein